MKQLISLHLSVKRARETFSGRALKLRQQNEIMDKK